MHTDEFHSQAYNFTSAVQGSVDPRTGLFVLNMPLVMLKGNNQIGPELNLALRYTPVSQAHQGLGTGITLGLSYLDTSTSTLTLSTGEQYKVVPGTIELRHKKMDNFRLAFTNDGDGYQITYNDGRTEFLTYRVNDTYLLTRTATPLGHSLYFTWYPSNVPMLTSVRDDTGQNLCTFDYRVALRPVLNILPDTALHRQIAFQLMGDTLISLQSQTHEGESFHWAMDYGWADSTQQLWAITAVSNPIGGKESVVYDMAEGMRFPVEAEPKEALPRVIEHRRVAGYGQPDIVTQFEYSPHNYLGLHGSFGEWASDSDYLYGTLTDYTYSSTETGFDNAGTPIATTRTWNNYHLQVEEEVRKGSCTRKTQIIYHALPGVHFSDQPVNCMQPRITRCSWWQADATRQEVTTTTFDEGGQLVREEMPDGTVTKYEYYSSLGEKGCPPDPYGFKRLVKSITVVPPSSSYRDEPISRSEYQYVTIPTLLTHATPYAIVQESITYKLNGTTHTTEAFSYHVDPGINLGRVKSKRFIRYDTLGNTYQTLQYLTMIRIDHRLTQCVQTLVLDQEGTPPLFTLSTTSQLCCYSGQMLSETDAAGNIITYTYDTLGRLKTKTTHPDRPSYTNTETWTYSLPNLATGAATATTHTDILGNVSRTDYDGMGREIARFVKVRDLPDVSHEWQKISDYRYDRRGIIFQTYSYDVLYHREEGREIIARSRSIHRDDWEQPYSIIEQNGVTQYAETNPISLTTTRWKAGRDGVASGKEKVYYDTARKPVRRELYAANGELYSITRQGWDGVHRLRKVIDALGRETSYTYDENDHIIAEALPNGDVIHKCYTPFSERELITKISLTNPMGSNVELGTQVFDRLGRLTRKCNGGRTHILTYQYAWQSKPSSVSAPDGIVKRFTTDPALGEAITQVHASNGSHTLIQTLDYDKSLGVMRSATEDNTVSSRDIYPSGRLKSEVSAIRGSSKQRTHYRYSLSGMLEQRSDVENATQVYSYGTSGTSIGQLSRIQDEHITITPRYDDLWRLVGWNVLNNATKHMLTVQLELDDFGREVRRIISHDKDDTLTLNQVWDVNHRLIQRTTYRNAHLQCSESFSYDACHRLISYHVTGDQLPTDPYGNKFVQQDYMFSTLGRMTRCATILADGDKNVAEYHFANTTDPNQVTSITNSLMDEHHHYPHTISLHYDAAGRMILDELGHERHYDALGRLRHVSGQHGSAHYGYDAHNRLVWQMIDGSQQIHHMYYHGSRLSNEWIIPEGNRHPRDINNSIRLAYLGQTPVAQIDKPGGCQLLGTDGKSSVLLTYGDVEAHAYRYTPYGYQSVETSAHPGRGNLRQNVNSSLLGFNGERRDLVSGAYHLGNGARSYSPILMNFAQPDSLSPFDAGGITTYAYCNGDPINRVDPSGHISWQAGIGVALSILGILGAAITGGMSIAATASISAALAATSTATLVVGASAFAADVTGIASAVTEEKHPEASAILGWLSFATGILSGLGGVAFAAGKAIPRTTRATSSKISVARNFTPKDSNIAVAEAYQARAQMRPIANSGDLQTPVPASKVWELQLSTEKSGHYIKVPLASKGNQVIDGTPPNGTYQFVNRADEPGIVRIAKLDEESRVGAVYGHTSMTQDGSAHAMDVNYAGDITFSDGSLISWTNNSGHYKPGYLESQSNLIPYIRRLLPNDKFRIF